MTAFYWALAYVVAGLVVVAVDWHVNEHDIHAAAHKAAEPFGGGVGGRLFAASTMLFAIIMGVATWPVRVVLLAAKRLSR